MNISQADVDAILRSQDIEGLLAVGAPQDEYLSEAGEIALLLEDLTSAQASEEEISARVMRVWVHFFGPFSAEDVQKRSPVLRQIVLALRETARRNEAAQHSQAPVFIS